MKYFKTWFSNNLVVNRYPLPGEITLKKYDYIINVSDEYISHCHTAATNVNTKYFWFPMNECCGDMGLNSLYGAMQILWNAELENAKVLVHCHAGANRSPMIREAYYFLRTGGHFDGFEFDEELEERLNEFFNDGKPFKVQYSRLKANCEGGHLPPLEKTEKFLKFCSEMFQKEETRRGGCLDSCKLKSEIES